jgi:hypothetical protein
MASMFDPTPDAVRELEGLANEIPGIQETLVSNHRQLTRPDRAAHQQQIAGGKVLLRVAPRLPGELEGLGLFEPDTNPVHVGIGRISTGLGCPHIETDPDFLGIMLAFRTREGQRIDLLGINDPSTPTDTPEEFIALLKATADAAGTEIPGGSIGSLNLPDLAATQTALIVSLARHAGWKAPRIAAHVTRQTSRTLLSSTAYQQYWTGAVKARRALGKFTLVPTEDVNALRELTPGERYLSVDWRKRQSEGPLDFNLYWIPFIDEGTTPMDRLTKGWLEDHRVNVGTVTFPKVDPASTEAKLLALLASEMGANPGNWTEQPGPVAPTFPATEYTAARALAYRKSQGARDVLAEERYHSFFEKGEISPELSSELIRRYREKREAGHAVPDVGEFAEVS